jgi:hypothetical protein
MISMLIQLTLLFQFFYFVTIQNEEYFFKKKKSTMLEWKEKSFNSSLSLLYIIGITLSNSYISNYINLNLKLRIYIQ